MKPIDAIAYLMDDLDPGIDDVVVMPTKVWRYIKSGRTGLSSEAMLYHLMGVEIPDGGRNQHPLDCQDFERCLFLLENFPELKPRIRGMGKVSPEWEILVRHWKKLTTLANAGRQFSDPLIRAYLAEVKGRKKAGPRITGASDPDPVGDDHLT